MAAAETRLRGAHFYALATSALEQSMRQGVFAPATASGLPLRAPRSFTKHHRQGRAAPREGQKQPFLSPISYTVTDPRNPERSEGQRPHSVFEWVRAQRLTRCPLFARGSLDRLRLGRRSSRARDGKGSSATADWSGVLSRST